MADEISLIGVCLGAQLLAYAAGGDVEPLLSEKTSKALPEIGWSPIFSSKEITPKELKPFAKLPLEVLHWHGDRILLPKSAHLLASSER